MFSCFPSLPRPSTFCNLSLLDEIRRNKLASFKVQIFTYSPKHHECSRRLISLMAHQRSSEPFGGIFYTFAHMFEFAAKHDIKPFIRHLIRNKLSKGWFINCAFFTKALTEICQERFAAKFEKRNPLWLIVACLLSVKGMSSKKGDRQLIIT